MSTINEEVFALTEEETTFMPDDWAWQFLRLNNDYKNAYVRACEHETDDDLPSKTESHIANADGVRVPAGSDSACALEFGLSAWLDPSHESLPKLKGAGSWFFPLKRVVQEDPRLVEIGATWPAQRRAGRIPPESQPRLAVSETLFDYGGAKLAHLCSTPHRERMVWVAVDCSVPPDGQISALKTLAELHRAYWREGTRADRLPTTHTPTVAIETIDYEDVFSHVVFRRTHDAGASAEDTSALWRTVGIDALGPIGLQADACLRHLGDIHLELKEQGELKTYWPTRFPGDITAVTGPGGKPPESNRYLKALLVLASATPPADFGANDLKIIDDVANQVGILPMNARFPRWMENFYNGMERYHLPRAHNMVKKLYRWLVHAQISANSGLQQG